MRESPQLRVRERRARLDPVTDKSQDESTFSGAIQKLWPWIALAVLVFCWIAEASLCAARGF